MSRTMSTARRRTTWLALLLAGGLAAAAGLGNLLAQPTQPTAQDRWVTKAVVALLDHGHLLRQKLDDQISERTLKNYLKTLDPLKLYFTQADVDNFSTKWKTQLDDMAREGDITPAYEIFNAFLDRLDRQAQVARHWVNAEHDFTVDEVMHTDAEAYGWAKSPEELNERWRRRIKYEILVQESEEKPLEEIRDKLTRRYTSLTKRMRQTTSDEVLEWYLTAMTTAYDPHSTYMSPSTLQDFQISMRLELDGIGAALSSEDGVTTVSKVIPGGAAARDGRLQAKDVIIGVGQGDDGPIEDVREMKLRNVVELIRGKRGTVVRLQVIPFGKTKPEVYAITRDKISLDDSAARSDIIEEGKKPNGEPYRLGVIDLPSFYMDMSGSREDSPDYRSTTRDVRKILDKFNEAKVDAVILDLRTNGGGSLVEAINLTGLFIDQGPVVQVKDADSRVQAYDDRDKGAAWQGPLVVLTSKFSASASEIFAGAIQDYRRGLIIGDHSTHGKGTVQSLLDLGQRLFRGPNAPNLGALKITMQQFYRPNGESTQKRGVLADIELPSLTTHLDVAEGDLEHAIEFDKVPAAQYAATNMVDGALIEQLRVLSKQRCSQCEDFKKIQNRVDKYLKQKAEKAVPLNREKFLADRVSAEEDLEKQVEERQNPDRPVFERNYYNNEALAITLDYLRMTKVAGR